MQTPVISIRLSTSQVLAPFLSGTDTKSPTVISVLAACGLFPFNLLFLWPRKKPAASLLDYALHLSLFPLILIQALILQGCSVPVLAVTSAPIT
jgi:hypothetical protein